MSVILGGVSCEELVDNYNEFADIGQGTGSRKGYLCDWDQRYAVAQGLLGYTRTSTAGGAISLYLPHKHPQLYNCYCSRVEFEPVGEPSRGPWQVAWTKCKVWASFESARFNLSTLTGFGDKGFVYAEQRMSASCEYVTIPRAFTRFKTTNKPTKFDLGIRLALVDIEITLHQMPYMPSTAVFSSAGFINNASYLGVSTGKLLFNGVSTEEVANTAGGYSLDATYSFTARSQRWDYVFDGDNNRWDQAVWPDGSTPFISSMDMSTIIPGAYKGENYSEIPVPILRDGERP